jgi:hypothetical protein
MKTLHDLLHSLEQTIQSSCSTTQGTPVEHISPNQLHHPQKIQLKTGEACHELQRSFDNGLNALLTTERSVVLLRDQVRELTLF